MKKKVTSKSGLFLLEMMISILFFSIAAVICMQVFVKAHLLSREARDLNKAVSCAATGAEALMHISSQEELLGYLPGCILAEDGYYVVYYDREWKTCEAGSAYTCMEMWQTEGDGMRTGVITIGRIGEEEPVYQLETGRYISGSVKEGGGNE